MYGGKESRLLSGARSLALETGSPVQAITPGRSLSSNSLSFSLYKSFYTLLDVIFPSLLCPPATGFVQQFGVESILIYTAILLKKRIVVYAATLDALLKACR